jgi:hypothetical protein
MDKGKHDKYYLALGKFIDAFSRAEAAVQVVLWQIADIENSVAKAIFSGTRTRIAIDYIRRITEAQNQAIPQHIQDAFNHLNTINTTRDNIVHFGASENDDGSILISNRLIAHTEKSLKEFPISHVLLYEMSSDLATITVRLISHFYGRPDDESDEDWAETLQIAHAPFRYKPPQPNNTDRKTRKASGKSQRQRKPSLE